jgi:hypothetical protein
MLQRSEGRQTRGGASGGCRKELPVGSSLDDQPLT